MSKKLEKAIAAIENYGILLVYPIQNSKEPKSLWSALFPRTEMVWDWTDEAHSKVAEIWHLREELARSQKVVYAKWYKNRATFFSQEVFLYLLAYLESAQREKNLPRSSQEGLDCFRMDSPQSTKLFKENMGWQGKLMESHYNKSMKPLWEGLYLVGVGEVYDSSFPSLNIASTSTFFENLWLESKDIKPLDAEKFLLSKLGSENLFFKQAQKLAKLARN